MSILTSNPFDFEDPDGRQLLTTLATLYTGNQPALIQLVSSVKGLKASRVQFQGRSEESVHDILIEGAAAGVLRELVIRVKQNGKSTAYHPFFDSLLAAHGLAPQAADIFRSQFLGASYSRCFIDRAELRGYLKELTRQGGPHVLVVTGPDGSGKTYTWYLINHIASDQGFKARRFDFDEFSPLPPKPRDLMQQVALQLDLPQLPEIDANATVETQSRLLSNWLIGKVANSKDKFWLVFDHLDRPAVPRESLFLIENLAEAAERGQLADTRITMLGFTDVMSPAVERDARREVLTGIGRPQLEKFFTDTAESLGTTIEKAALQDAIASVLAGATTNGKVELEKLNEQVGLVAGALFAET